MRSAGTVLL